VRDGYSAAQSAELFRKLPDELSRVNGVRSVAMTGVVPFVTAEPNWPNARVAAPTGGFETAEVQVSVFRSRIGAKYFATLEEPLVRGREFDERDGRADAPAGAATPVVINQTAARALFGNADPIGRRLREDTLNYTVIGVARDVRAGFLVPQTVAAIFLPYTPNSFRANRGQSATVLVRGTAGRETLEAVRAEITALHPDLTVFKVRTAREDLAQLNSFIQWSSGVYITLGVFVLLLAGVGLGGVTAYAVAQRRKEIGIRMALGARGGQVRRLVLREGTALVTAGVLLGFCGALAIGRVLVASLSAMAPAFAAGAKDPMLIGGAPLLLAALALGACYWPARRATAVDPVRALREE
jgi:ABC-type antimicrobial peptide transport system permease subunit